MNTTEERLGTCLSKIHSLAGPKGSGTRKIADFVIKHPVDAMNLTITELAEKIGTSASTVSRFCTYLGYESYRAFQLDLTASLAGERSAISDHFQPSDKPDTIVERVFEMNRQSLADTARLLNNKDIVSVSKLIACASRIFLLGIGSSALAAKSGALRLAGLGLAVIPATDPYEALISLSSVGKNDVVIGISHTGKTAMIIKLLEVSGNCGATTVGITNYADSPLANISKYTFLTSFRERRVNAAVSSSLIAQMCLLDAIFFLTAYHMSSNVAGQSFDIDDLAQDLLQVS